MIKYLALAVAILTASCLLPRELLAASIKNISGVCLKDYNKWKKRGGYGAFVTSGNGGCAYTWDNESIEVARKNALARCRGMEKGQSCVVVDENKTKSEFRQKADSCGNGTNQEKIAACTWLIDSKRNKGADQAWNYNTRGIAHQNMGQIDLAIADYGAAVKADRTYPWAYMNRARLYRDKGKLVEAFADLNLALKHYKKGGGDYRDEAQRMITSIGVATSRIAGLTVEELCSLALVSNKSAWENSNAYSPHFNEAQRRNLSLAACRQALGYPPENNYFETFNTAALCNAALNTYRTGWSVETAYRNAISEATRRKLSVEACREAVGAVTPAIAYANADNKTVCAIALNKNRDWWDASAVAESAIKEASRRKLTIKDCIGLLAVPVAVTQPSEFENWPDSRLCIAAVNSNKTAWEEWRSYLQYVAEAKRRGLSVGKCRLAMGYPEQFNRFKLFSDKNLCAEALNGARDGWNNSASGILAQAEVERRVGDRLDWCLAILEVQVPVPAVTLSIEQPPAVSDVPPITAYQNADNRTVCAVAINKKRDWWDASATAMTAVGEAFRRKLTYKDCSGLLVVPVAITSSDKFKELSDTNLCRFAVNSNKSAWDASRSYLRHVSEAQRRGLSLAACRQAMGYPPEFNAFETFSTANLCSSALDNSRTVWSLDIKNGGAVREAARRKLSVEWCRNAIGAATPVATYRNADSEIVCSVALNRNRDWWDTTVVGRSAMREAIRRKLKFHDCAAMLSAQVAATESEFKNWPDAKLCTLAVNSNKMAWDESRTYVRHVSDAKRRGLTVGKCRLAMGYPEQFNQFELFNDKNLCADALNGARDGWNNSASRLLKNSQIYRLRLEF